MHRRIRTYLPFILFLVLLLVEIPCHNWIDQSAEKKEIVNINPFATLPPTEYLAEYLSTIILGGFKPFIVDYLWVKAEKLREDKQYYEVRALLSLIARLQPRCREAWTYNAWNMAYNISRQELDPALRWRWVKEGLDYLEEACLRNPEDYRLASDLAFIYYHRISQEEALMEWCYKEKGTDCYALAAKWYASSIDLSKKKVRQLYGSYGYEVMWKSARFLHAFALLKEGKFDEAISELKDCAAFGQDYLARTYKYDAGRWQKDAQGLLEIKKIFEQERILFSYKSNKASEQYWLQLERVLSQYKQLIHSRIDLDFNPLNKRVEILLLEYLGPVYRLLDQQRYQEALNGLQYVMKYADDFVPRDPYNHPDRWFFEELTQRFKELYPIIENEAKLLENYHAKSPETAQYLQKTLDLYKEYLKKESDSEWFNLTYEMKRVEFLTSFIK